MDQNALILGKSLYPCASGGCASLIKRLQNQFSFRHIEEREAAPAGLPFAPDLVVLRLAASASRENLISACRDYWPQAQRFGVICAGLGGPEGEYSLLLKGVDDFVTCPYQEPELFFRVERLLRAKRAAGRSCGSLTRPLDKFPLVGASAAFRGVLEKIPLVADSNHTVLVSGETGSGKEVVARAIHYQGNRRGKPFVAVNCGALPDHLFENELFGHVKGAFTDASSTEKGLIAEAEGGTLFLDEIDALSHAGQVKLLRFLQDGEYRPVGSARMLLGDVRVIAATNADLARKVEAGQFRQDLYYRLNALGLMIPPLRERIEDLTALTNYFLTRFAQQHGQEVRQVSAQAMAKLTAFSWPGNIRELESVITRSLTFSRSMTLHADDIELPLVPTQSNESPQLLRDAKLNTVNAFEHNFLANLLAKYRGNVSRAAKAAGKERRTFQRLLRKHGLSRRSFEL